MQFKTNRLPHFCFLIAMLLLPSIRATGGDTAYQKPPKQVLDLLNAPVPPQPITSPTKDQILLVETARYPSIEDLAEPMLRLAGLRLNPATNGPQREAQVTSLTLVRIGDGSSRKINLPASGKPGRPIWSADGKHFAFTNTMPNGIELWVGNSADGKTRKIPGIAVNAAYGTEVQWMPDQKSLLVAAIPAGRGKAPEAPKVPKGPTIQENYGKSAPVWTFQDLLENSHDEDLFEYYATAQLGIAEIASGKWSPIGKPSIFQTAEPSPDGRFLLVARVHRPFSYMIPHFNFPKDVEIWDRTGTTVHTLAKLPLQEQIPVDGAALGPRSYEWRATEPSTLVYATALDEGNPRAKVPHRDRILMLKAPFGGEPVEVAKTEFRYAGVRWFEKDGTALLSEFDRPTRTVRSWLITPDTPGQAPRKIFDRNMQDRYNDPGTPVSRVLANGQSVIWQSGDRIFLSGEGASPDGDRPFLNAFDIKTLKAEGLFRCSGESYESVIALLADDGSRFLTRYETAEQPPNLYEVSRGNSVRRALTKFADPAPQLRQIHKELVTYKRPDGVQLSFTLYLPAGYRKGERLPTVMWAYPLEYTDARTAGQVSGSPYRFTTMGGPSHLFFLLQGYAILDNATMPVIGDAETVNNTYLEQIVSSAKAAIDKAAEMGVTDPDRVGVGGHSYGAFMTANLLTHSGLFKAGIARSGAYNRTLTPFGFQSERRTLWEAPETYFKMSPFLNVGKINTPILLIHGEADNNSGTFPIQSERYYHALKGNGKTARYVTLPLESHGYAARESIEHTLYEMISWFDRYVKNPGSSGPSGPGRDRR